MAKKKVQSQKLKDPKWEKFCLCYTSNRELFGNATHAYAEAYGYKLDTLSRDDAVYEEQRDEDGESQGRKMIEPSSYDKAINSCAVQGNRLLRNVKINERINSLLNELFKDEIIDAELSWVIMQRTDLSPKVSAIKEYNSLRLRTKPRLELSGPGGKPLFDEDTQAKSKNSLKEYLSRGNTRGGK